MITFDEEGHKYYLKDQELPSVTTILKKVGMIDDRFFNDEKRDLGSRVHKATELYDKQILSTDKVDADVWPYLKGWKSFIDTVKPEIIEIEKIVYDDLYRFAGTLDRIVKIKNRRTILEIKTGMYAPYWNLQTAAYNYCEPDCLDRAAVILQPNKFIYRQITGINDEQVFLSACAIHHWINNNLEEK